MRHIREKCYEFNQIFGFDVEIRSRSHIQLPILGNNFYSVTKVRLCVHTRNLGVKFKYVNEFTASH